MKRSSLAGAWVHGTRQLRHRWASWLGLVVLLGVAGGVVTFAAAGARRTTSTYDRLLASARPFDVVVSVSCPDDLDAVDCIEEARPMADEILRLPMVATGAAAVTALPPVLMESGYSIQPQDEVLEGEGDPPGATCITGSGSVEVRIPLDDRLGNSVNRYRFVSGRAVDPTRPEEAVLSVATARRAGIEVGDSLRIVPVASCEGPDPESWPSAIDVTIVGLQVSPGEVQPEKGFYLQSITVSPLLLRRLADADTSGVGLMIRLRDGASVDDLTAAIEATGLPVELALVQDDFSADVRRGLRPDALSLWLLAGFGGLAAAIVLGQALSRQAWSRAEQLPALRAIGFTSRDLVIAGGVEGAAAGALASLMAAGLAVAASPLAPIGRARAAEPDPGMRFDALAVGLGALGVVLFTSIVFMAATRRVARRATRTERPITRAALLPDALARVGAPLPLITGARLALEPRQGRGVPRRSGFLGVAVGATVLIASLTFSASLDHLLATPRLVGWNWDVEFLGGVPLEDDDADPLTTTAQLMARAGRVEGVEHVGYGTFFPSSDVPILEAVPDVWPLSFSTGPGSIEPTVTTGRAPAGPDEILVTRTILDELGKRVGDTITVQGERPSSSGTPRVREVEVTIVGTGVLPIGDGLFERSVAMTFDGMQRLVPDLEPELVTVDIAANADVGRVVAALENLGLEHPLRADDLNVTALVDLDVREADNLPRVLGVLMLILALGVLAHLVGSGVRAGRRDGATLRALGFSPGQLRRAAGVQATILAFGPSIVAVLVGGIAGRAIWLAYADELQIAPETAFPWLPAVVSVLALLVSANVVAAVVGWNARRHRWVRALRSE